VVVKSRGLLAGSGAAGEQARAAGCPLCSEGKTSWRVVGFVRDGFAVFKVVFRYVQKEMATFLGLLLTVLGTTRVDRCGCRNEGWVKISGVSISRQRRHPARVNTSLRDDR